ncbi:zinc finger MYM-type protein 6 [Trichonephila clavipes]|uniref:Zinc finger MYM-type protein 6 n=1 Tax=Trichonephila clavipes TaxID=2585209 RepID=A0A8X6RI80_TRICX|nr:zinc finger MYM-type protein 6 [Trichonephila clavipes]
MLQKFGTKNNWRKIFEVINEYFEAKSLAWANCVVVCTDDAAALTGSNKELRGLIQKVAPHMVFNYCMIHRQALVAKDVDEELHNILQDAVVKANRRVSFKNNSEAAAAQWSRYQILKGMPLVRAQYH